MLVPQNILPATVEIGLDPSMMLFALALAIGTGLLFGLAPAVQAGRTSLVGAMKEGGHGATPGSPGRRLRSMLVITEIALAFVLLVGSGLLMRSLFSLLEVDPGFDSANVLTAALPIAQSQYPDAVELNNYLLSIQQSVDALPGVRETAVTSALPLQGWGYGMPYFVTGRDFVDRANRQGGFFKMVSPNYFESLRIEILAGRSLRDTDTAGAPPVMLINERLAEREFPDEDPIGQRIEVQQIVPGRQELGPEIAWEIVGVIRDEKIGGLDDELSAGMYVSNLQSPVYGISLLVRAEIEPLGLERSVRGAIAAVNQNQALSQVRTLEQIEYESVTAWRVQGILLGTFAAVALALAAIGIYGVMSYSIEQRTNEIGIRAALGASSGQLRKLVFRSGMRLTVIGLVIGIIASVAATRVMASLLYGVSSYDPLTLGAVALLLGSVAALACLVPALRATRVDPLIALRYQ
jgi:putative ABC transport system permease protein